MAEKTYQNKSSQIDLSGATATRTPEVDVDALPPLDKVYLKTAFGIDEISLSHSPLDLGKAKTIATLKHTRKGLRRWERISLALLFSIAAGFTAGASLGLLILDGKFDISKNEFKAFIDVLKTHQK
jgi:hypothetical protein